MNERQKARQAPVKRILISQLGLSLVLGLSLLAFDQIGALSIVLGGLICLLPNSYFAWRLFAVRGARSSRDIAKAFYKGEAGKLLITIVLFALVFSMVKPLNVLALFAGFVAVQMMNWIVPLVWRGPSTGS
ncbi:ATP synthase subunit I [Pokkaliibacter plantistimulans]|uniref:ATP synthase subunit I n=1 Tax=Pokkaliibacter plantistimulans TaxID=1635171 RepID=UPI0026785C79|nr:ATP synthase subunit I [Pokkaliibacter plantistimulans]